MGDVAPPSNGGAAGGSLAGLLAGAQPHIQTPNILGALQQGQQLQTARYHNQALGAQLAQGQLLQQATNPNGTVDYRKFNALVAQTPGAAFGAQAADQSALDYAHKQYALHMQKMGNFMNGLNSAVLTAQKDPSNAPKIFRNYVVDAAANGIMSPNEAARVLGEIPSDPQQAIQAAQALSTSLMNAQAQAHQIAGAPIQIDNGANVLIGRQPPNGPVTVQGVVPKTLSPAQSIAPVTLMGPNGRQVQVPAETVAGGLPPNTMGTGAASPAQQDVIAYRNGGLPGPMPGTVEGEKAGAQQNAAIGTQIIEEGSDVQPTISNLMDLGAQIDDANPGPLAKAQAFYGGIASELGLSVSKQASAEQIFTKLTNMLATQNLSGLGHATDEKLNTLLASTPNASMTRDAAKTVWANAIGLQQYREARYKAYQGWLAKGNLPSSAAAFNEQFQNETSPLILGLQYMPPKQQVTVLKYISGLPKAAQEKFNQQLIASKNAGLISW